MSLDLSVLILKFTWEISLVKGITGAVAKKSGFNDSSISMFLDK